MANLGAYYILDGRDSLEIQNLCLHYNIRHLRLSEPNIDLFHSFQSSQIYLSFDIPNQWLETLSIDHFFDTYLKPYLRLINFKYIIVGKDMNGNILPAMNQLQDILDANSINIKVTTQWSYDGMLFTRDPPSAGQLPDTDTRGIIRFLKSRDIPLMIKVYPYRQYIRNNNISLEYATFNNVARPVQDGRFLYYNLFDAMVDTFYAAISKIGEGDLNLVVGETGWPTSGYRSTLAIAANYNKKFKTHIRGNGTPLRPNVHIKEGFIRGLFNDNEGDYGVFDTNFTPLYQLFG